MYIPFRALAFSGDGSIIKDGNEATLEELIEVFSAHDGRLIQLKPAHIRRILMQCGRPIFKGGFGTVYVSKCRDAQLVLFLAVFLAYLNVLTRQFQTVSKHLLNPT